VSKHKHTWQQRKIWREAKRAWRADIKRYKERKVKQLKVFLGQRDISDRVTVFSADTTSDMVRVDTDSSGFQVYETLGLSYVDVTIKLLCDPKFRNWLEHLFRLGQSHQLRVYQGDRKVYQMRVLFQSITWSTSASGSTVVFADIRFRSAGKVQHG